jgi:hypothetical protein
MTGRSKGKGLKKCRPWSSRMGVGHGANSPIPEKFPITKRWRRPRLVWGCSISENSVLILQTVYILQIFNFTVVRVLPLGPWEGKQRGTHDTDRFKVSMH